jgi:hypothetical protein
MIQIAEAIGPQPIGDDPKAVRFQVLDESGGEVLVGCTLNAASLKNLEQLSKRCTQTALLFFTRQSASDSMTVKKERLTNPSHASASLRLRLRHLSPRHRT